jgi:hypothetical protein
MLKRIAAVTLATLFLAGPALAEPAIFTWTGYGLNVPGSGKCPTYKMTIDVTVVGTDVQGRSLKEGASTIMLDGYCLFEGKLTKK